MAQNDTTPQQKRRLVLLSLGLALAFGVLSLFASPPAGRMMTGIFRWFSAAALTRAGRSIL